jgi:hypothetical protein
MIRHNRLEDFCLEIPNVESHQSDRRITLPAATFQQYALSHFVSFNRDGSARCAARRPSIPSLEYRG